MAACALEPVGSGAGMCVYMYRRIWLLQLRPIQEPVVQTTVKPLGLAFPSWLPVRYTEFSTDTAGCTQCLIQLKSQSLRGKKKQQPGHSCAYAMNIYVPQPIHSHMSFVPHQNKKAPLSGVTVVVTKSPPFFTLPIYSATQKLALKYCI